MFKKTNQKKTILILGDTLTLLIVTLIGFATHGETSISFLLRMLTTFIPLLVGWFLLAPWFGLFNSELNSNSKQLWRPAFAMLFAGPLAVVLRGLILNAPIIPIFAVVLSATSALGLMIWRTLYFVLKSQRLSLNNKGSRMTALMIINTIFIFSSRLLRPLQELLLPSYRVPQRVQAQRLQLQQPPHLQPLQPELLPQPLRMLH